LLYPSSPFSLFFLSCLCVFNIGSYGLNLIFP
jgi:hypothetical protein